MARIDRLGRFSEHLVVGWILFKVSREILAAMMLTCVGFHGHVHLSRLRIMPGVSKQAPRQ